jgi:glycosyltransferase involved in cell wall biosynthesis
MRILHVFRSPVGGLFRHVCDLARGQHALGHEVGVFCDSSGGGDFANQMLARIEPYCALGIFRAPIARQPGISDISGCQQAYRVARRLRPDVIHGHGAKGGLYGRTAAYRLGIVSSYTPHYGSLAFDWASASGAAILAVEVLLRRIGTGLSFVCNYERDLFDAKIGIGGKAHTTIYNGIWPEEFHEPELQPDATDFMSLCEIRAVKGIDILIRALARFDKASLTVVGDGPEKTACIELARSLGIADRVRFPGSLMPQEAVRTGRIMVLPSHRESFPYVVVEAGASRKPLVATRVGGISEVVPEALLCAPGSVEELHAKMKSAHERDATMMASQEQFFATVRKSCSADVMCAEITAFYQRMGAR